MQNQEEEIDHSKVLLYLNTVAEIYGIYIKSVQCSFTVTSNGSIFSTGYIFNHVREDVTNFLCNFTFKNSDI